ncbi:DUF4145 domain-containing protein [Variovorax humicola]|uniref:DUF4145 domain-containing protein n=1 Tax=Variovorax humicola TaxID=1769758 RepID=A0ABU8VUR1_9BURK
MNKEIWKRSIWDQKCPPWPCPSCSAGVVAVEPGSFKHAPTKASIAESAEDWWGPENVVHSFVAWGMCSNALCSEAFSLAGTGTVEIVPDEQGGADYEDAFELRYCHPTLRLITLPKQCPDSVAEALTFAFSLYWVDRPAAAGRIRVAVERLLDHLGIPAKSKKGGYLPLDQRIDAFSKNDPANGAHLMALKWLGNVGSHTDYVNADDLLAAFEITEHALAEIIDKKSASIARLAASITAKYGKP